MSSRLHKLTLGGSSNKQRRPEDIKRVEKIKSLTAQLKDGNISVEVFLESMCETLPKTGTLKANYCEAKYFVRPSVRPSIHSYNFVCSFQKKNKMHEKRARGTIW